MKYLIRIVAVAGLALTLIPPIVFYLGGIPESSMKRYVFIGTLIWFAGAIPWLGRKKELQ